MSERPFRASDPESLQKVLADLDWDQVQAEAEAFSQSPWTQDQLRRWLSEGQWQLLELPSVLNLIRARHDALIMEEMGVCNVAVFGPDQVHGVPDPMAPQRRRPFPRA